MNKKRYLYIVCFALVLLIFFPVELFSSNASLDTTPIRVVLTIGEDPTSSVGISWQNNYDIEDDVLRIVKKKLDFYSPEAFKYYQVKSNVLEFDSEGIKKRSYQVRVEGLEENTEYVYVVGNTGRWTKPKIFKTLNKDQDLKIAFLGDPQGYKQSQYDDMRMIYDKMIEEHGEVDYTLIVGDLIDDPKKYEQWMFLENSMKDHFNTSFFAVAVGNHDNIDLGASFTKTFTGPLNGVESLENRTYYFEMSDVLFIVFDTESANNFWEQELWLTEITENSKAKYKVILMHRSVYPMSYNESWIRDLADNFEDAKIDLVLSGHDHIYNRTSMLSDEKTEVGSGVTYVVGGSSTGSKYYDEDSVNVDRYWKNVVYGVENPIVSFLEKRDGKLVFNAYAYTSDGIVLIDSFEIEK